MIEMLSAVGFNLETHEEEYSEYSGGYDIICRR